jgi:hypothetical protein
MSYLLYVLCKFYALRFDISMNIFLGMVLYKIQTYF